MAKAWFNGNIIEADAAAVPLTDRGLTLGDGLFETIKVRDGVPLRLDQHLARLTVSAQVLAIPIPYDQSQLWSAIQKTAQENGLQNAAVRLTITRGSGPRGLLPPDDQTPSVFVTVGALPPPSGPVRAITSQLTRRNELSVLSNIKTTNYGDLILARREAADKGADEAILLNTVGRVAETTISNIFVLVKGALLTPPLEDGVLPGVMRGHVIGAFRGEEQPLQPSIFQEASEAFLTNALGVRPLVEVDGHPIGDGEPGLVTQMLQSRL